METTFLQVEWASINIKRGFDEGVLMQTMCDYVDAHHLSCSSNEKRKKAISKIAVGAVSRHFLPPVWIMEGHSSVFGENMVQDKTLQDLLDCTIFEHEDQCTSYAYEYYSYFIT